jgi:pilus assembly protein CpaE
MIRTTIPIRVLAVLRSPETGNALKENSAQLNGVRIEVLNADLGAVTDDLLAYHRPNVVLTDVNLADQQNLARLGNFIQQHGQRIAVIATSPDASMDGMRQLMRLGVTDILRQPIATADLVTAFQAVADRLKLQDAGGRASGRILSFIKSVGGAGATTIAIQTACSLVKEHKARVCLLDFDIQWGTVGLYLDLQPMRSIVDMVQAGDRLDAAYLEALMLKHDSGIEVLPAPAHIVALDTLTPELVERTLTFLGYVYDYIVIDLPHVIVPWVSYVLANSALMYLVMQLNVTSIRQAQRFLEVLRDGDLASVPLATILNRYEKSLFGDGVRIKEAEKALRTKFDFTISNDFKTAIAAQNQGVPLSRIAGRSRIVKDVEAMVEATVKRLAAGAELGLQPRRMA